MRVREVQVMPLFVDGDVPPAECWEYEVWDADDRLVYVGVADNFDRRWRQHEDKSWWLNEVKLKYVVVNGYRSRDEARQVEAQVINEHAPVYNTNREIRHYKRFLEHWDSPFDEWTLMRVDHRLFEAVGS